MSKRSEEKSAHEPCVWDRSRVVQCCYCKPVPPISAELRMLMARRRALWPENVYPMPGDPRVTQAQTLDVQIATQAAREGFHEVDAWRAYA